MRRILGLLAGAVLWFSGTAAVPAAGNAPSITQVALSPAGQAAMDSARERVAAGDLDGALKTLSTFVAAHPGEAPPERLLGDLYYRHGEMTKAQDAYQHILSYAPFDKETHSRLGSVYAAENRIDDAIAEFNRSLPGTDSIPDLVQLHLRKGDFPQYKHDREEMVREYPGDTDAVLELGQLYEFINQPRLAMQYFQRVLDTQPHSIFALNGMGMAYADLHADSDAVIDLKLCLVYDPYNYDCWTNLGGAFLDMRQYTDAGKALDVARRLEPERPEALVNIGNLADDSGDWKRAVSYYVQAMTVDPFQPDSYINLGITYEEHGLYQLEQAAVVKGLAIAPQDGRLHFLLGDIYRHDGQTAQAQSQYQQAAAQDMFMDVRALAQRELATLEHAPVQSEKP